MRRSNPAFLIGLIVFSAAFISVSEVSADNGWGETIGPVYAIVRGTDVPGGLNVRSSPDERSPILGRLGVGAKIRAYNQFHRGWVQVRTPVQGGWIRIDLLEPLGGEAVVSGVDRPEGCLRIRSGPSTATQVIGCANLGETLLLTGIWSEGPWAQVAKPVPGWVYTPQILSSLSPPDTPTGVAYSRPPPRIHVGSSPVYNYSSVPFWSGLYLRSWNYPYRKYRRHIRHYPGYKTWKYPARKHRRHVRHHRGNNFWRNPARTYRSSVRQSRRQGAWNSGSRNWSLRAGRRGTIGVPASRTGRTGTASFRAGRRGTAGFRGGRRGFAARQMGGSQARGRRR
jgi:uncharacterized protein YraI